MGRLEERIEVLVISLVPVFSRDKPPCSRLEGQVSSGGNGARGSSCALGQGGQHAGGGALARLSGSCGEHPVWEKGTTLHGFLVPAGNFSRKSALKLKSVPGYGAISAYPLQRLLSFIFLHHQVEETWCAGVGGAPCGR